MANGLIRYAYWSFFLMADFFPCRCRRDFSLKLMDFLLTRSRPCPRWLIYLLRVFFVAPRGLALVADGPVADTDWIVLFKTANFHFDFSMHKHRLNDSLM